MLLGKRVFCMTMNGWGDEPYWACENLIDECSVFERWIRRHFELPKQISKVIISLHSQPSVNRKKGRVKRYPDVKDWAILKFGRTEWDEVDLDPILLPLIDQTVYLQVEYE